MALRAARRRDLPLEDLLEMVAEGDGSAFEAMYDRVSATVFGLARKIVVDRDLAADVAQETLVAVWGSAGGFDRSRGPAMAWIATLTRRRAIDMIRSREASRRRESDQRLDPEPPDPVGETVVGDAERSAVSAALGSLSDLQRESLELAFYRGLTHTEIARRLGVPLGTVKTRIRAGLLSLASHMEAFSGE